MKKAALMLMIITIVSKLFGLVRDLSLSYFFGTSNISDAYFVASAIPSVLFGFVTAAIAIGFIPSYNKVESEFGELQANRFTSNLINITILLCSLLIIIGVIAATPLVKLFAVGFEGETLKLAVNMTRIMVFGGLFSGITCILSAYYQIKGRFIIPALIGFPLNLILIISVFISAETNVLVMAIGSSFAYFSQLLLLIFFLPKSMYRHVAILNLKDKKIKSMLYVVGPLMIGFSVNQINFLVDKTVASQIAIGGISALNYANQLSGFVMGIVVLSITTVMYPTISRMAAQKNIAGLKKTLLESIGSINLLVIPASVGAMVLAEPIVIMIYGRGAFDERAINMTSTALFFYSIGMIGYGLRDVLTRAFFSIQDAKTPMFNGAVATVTNILLILILSKFLGVGGLALATSISGLLATGLLFASLRKKIGPFGIRRILISSTKILFASAIMGVVAKVIIINSTTLPLAISLAFSISSGIIVYSTLIMLLRIEEVDIVLESIKATLFKAKE